VSLYLFAFVAFIMASVMDTAKDRDAYLHIFENPFHNSRIEIGFLHYANFFDILNIAPSASIVITCVIIYFLLSRVFFFYKKKNWLISILLFNFFAFGLMNYYLGTSIRMGLAISIALFSGIKILQGSKLFWLPFMASFFIHYGIIVFLLIFSWVFVFRDKEFGFHALMISVATKSIPASPSLAYVGITQL
jgi:hypothetical protein